MTEQEKTQVALMYERQQEVETLTLRLEKAQLQRDLALNLASQWRDRSNEWKALYRRANNAYCALIDGRHARGAQTTSIGGLDFEVKDE